MRSAAGARLAAALAGSARLDAPRATTSAAGWLSARAGAGTSADRQVETESGAPATAGRLADTAGTALRTGTAAAGAGRPDDVAAGDSTLDVKATVMPAAAFVVPVHTAAADATAVHANERVVATAARFELDQAVESALPRQIVQAMQLQWKDGIGDARVTLQPEYLGELTVAIRVDHGSVTALLEASTPAIRQWLESHEPALRQSLAEQGLHLDKLTVSDEPPEAAPQRERRREGGQPKQEEPQRQPRRRPAVDDTTFEVIV
jgi:flagellar hook-length control protein FliK